MSGTSDVVLPGSGGDGKGLTMRKPRIISLIVVAALIAAACSTGNPSSSSTTTRSQGLEKPAATTSVGNNTPPPLDLGENNFDSLGIMPDGRYILGALVVFDPAFDEKRLDKVLKGNVPEKDSRQSFLIIIDSVTNTILKKVPVPTPNIVASGATNKFAYVVTYEAIYVYSLSSETLGDEVATFEVSSAVEMVHQTAVSADEKYLYVAGLESVYVVDTVANVIKTVIPTAAGAPDPCGGTNMTMALGLSPDGESLYVLNEKCVLRVDKPYDPSVQTPTWTDLYAAGGIEAPLDFVLSQDGSKMYVAQGNLTRSEDNPSPARGIYIFDTATMTNPEHILADPPKYPNEPADPYSLSLSPDGRTLYIYNGGYIIFSTMRLLTIETSMMLSMMNIPVNTMSDTTYKGRGRRRTSLSMVWLLQMATSSFIQCVCARCGLCRRASAWCRSRRTCSKCKSCTADGSAARTDFLTRLLAALDAPALSAATAKPTRRHQKGEARGGDLLLIHFVDT